MQREVEPDDELGKTSWKKQRMKSALPSAMERLAEVYSCGRDSDSAKVANGDQLVVVTGRYCCD